MRLHRFSAAVLSFALAATPLASAQAHSAATDPDLLELQHYTLTMDKVNRFADSMTDMVALSNAHPELKNKLETDSKEHESLSDIEHRISSQPLIVSTIAKHGFTPHEFVVFEMTFFQAAFAQAMLKEPGVDRNKMIADAHVNPANITFIEQHQTELQAMQQKLQPESEKKKPAPANSGSEDDN